LVFVLKAIRAAARSLLLPGNISFGLLAVVATVITGPFDTLTRLTVEGRVLYWGGVVVFSIFIATLAQKLVYEVNKGLSPAMIILVDSAAMTFLFSPIAYVWTVLFFDISPTMADFLDVVVNVALVSLVIFACRKLVFDWARMATFERSQSGAFPVVPPVQDGASAAQPRLARRIAEDDPGPIRRIEAMNHFVTVFTEKDSYQIRMRFADAVDEMDGIPGMVTHRSHWVASEMVEEVERENGRLLLRLNCGTRVPVSRKYRPALEEAGLV
jgi:DNA-binding LytR/AlgR family response regulator